MNKVFYILFHTKSSQPSVCSMFTTHPKKHRPHFRYSTVAWTSGDYCWPLWVYRSQAGSLSSPPPHLTPPSTPTFLLEHQAQPISKDDKWAATTH